jgi:hypothetical protein
MLFVSHKYLDEFSLKKQHEKSLAKKMHRYEKNTNSTSVLYCTAENLGEGFQQFSSSFGKKAGSSENALELLKIHSNHLYPSSSPGTV